MCVCVRDFLDLQTFNHKILLLLEKASLAAACHEEMPCGSVGDSKIDNGAQSETK